MNSTQTILVIDDEASVRRSIHAILDSQFKVVACADGPAAIKFVVDHPGEVCAAFVDYGMPGMDGNTVCSELRLVDATISLIGFSGHEEAVFSGPLFARLGKKHISSEGVLALAASAVCSAEQRRQP